MADELDFGAPLEMTSVTIPVLANFLDGELQLSEEDSKIFSLDEFVVPEITQVAETSTDMRSYMQLLRGLATTYETTIRPIEARYFKSLVNKQEYNGAGSYAELARTYAASRSASTIKEANLASKVSELEQETLNMAVLQTLTDYTQKYKSLVQAYQYDQIFVESLATYFNVECALKTALITENMQDEISDDKIEQLKSATDYLADIWKQREKNDVDTLIALALLKSHEFKALPQIAKSVILPKQVQAVVKEYKQVQMQHASVQKKQVGLEKLRNKMTAERLQKEGSSDSTLQKLIDEANQLPWLAKVQENFSVVDISSIQVTFNMMPGAETDVQSVAYTCPKCGLRHENIDLLDFFPHYELGTVYAPDNQKIRFENEHTVAQESAWRLKVKPLECSCGTFTLAPYKFVTDTMAMAAVSKDAVLIRREISRTLVGLADTAKLAKELSYKIAKIEFRDVNLTVYDKKVVRGTVDLISLRDKENLTEFKKALGVTNTTLALTKLATINRFTDEAIRLSRKQTSVDFQNEFMQIHASLCTGKIVLAPRVAKKIQDRADSTVASRIKQEEKDVFDNSSSIASKLDATITDDLETADESNIIEGILEDSVASQTPVDYEEIAFETGAEFENVLTRSNSADSHESEEVYIFSDLTYAFEILRSSILARDTGLSAQDKEGIEIILIAMEKKVLEDGVKTTIEYTKRYNGAGTPSKDMLERVWDSIRLRYIRSVYAESYNAWLISRRDIVATCWLHCTANNIVMSKKKLTHLLKTTAFLAEQKYVDGDSVEFDWTEEPRKLVATQGKTEVPFAISVRHDETNTVQKFVEQTLVNSLLKAYTDRTPYLAFESYFIKPKNNGKLMSVLEDEIDGYTATFKSSLAQKFLRPLDSRQFDDSILAAQMLRGLQTKTGYMPTKYLKDLE